MAYFLLNQKKAGGKQWHNDPQIDTPAWLNVYETQCFGIPQKMFQNQYTSLKLIGKTIHVTLSFIRGRGTQMLTR